jgi:hypothetical protein
MGEQAVNFSPEELSEYTELAQRLEGLHREAAAGPRTDLAALTRAFVNAARNPDMHRMLDALRVVVPILRERVRARHPDPYIPMEKLRVAAKDLQELIDTHQPRDGLQAASQCRSRPQGTDASPA